MTLVNTILNVAGMSCGSCVRHVTSALSAVPGVSKVNVQLKSGLVEVQHQDDAPLQALIEALQDAGYDARVRSH
ncbi:MAG: heavy metal-associated domain-containing protein [Deltaproteobacteria bacterium]